MAGAVAQSLQVSRLVRGGWGLACIQEMAAGRDATCLQVSQLRDSGTAGWLVLSQRLPAARCPDATRMQRTGGQRRGGLWKRSNSPTYFTPLITGQAVWRECGSNALPSGCNIGDSETAVQGMRRQRREAPAQRGQTWPVTNKPVNQQTALQHPPGGSSPSAIHVRSSF